MSRRHMSTLANQVQVGHRGTPWLRDENKWFLYWESSETHYDIITYVQNIVLVFWYAVAVTNNMLKFMTIYPKGVIATRVKHKCTGKLVFIKAGGGRWCWGRPSSVCPRAPIEQGLGHRSMTPNSITPTAPSCINYWIVEGVPLPFGNEQHFNLSQCQMRQWNIPSGAWRFGGIKWHHFTREHSFDKMPVCIVNRSSTQSSGRGRSWIAGPAGISRLGPNSELRGNNRSFPETRERDRVLVKKIGSRDSIFGLVNSTYSFEITNHNQHASNIKYLANFIKKYWTYFRYQKLADFLVCLPPSVRV